jgi:HipA-like protein
MDSTKTEVIRLLGSGPKGSPDLAQALGTSASSVLRSLRALEQERRVLRMGKTRGARYALRRAIAAIGSNWPIYRVDEDGAVHCLGTLEAIESNSYYVTAGPARIAGLFAGIPYFLQDARPAGFQGRAIPGAYPELALPTRVVDWTDEHFLVYLTRRASDTTGALIVGSESMDRHLAGTHRVPLVPENDRVTEYPRFADQAMAGSPPGSSAQGEHPKFTAWVGTPERRVAVIVKFSPPHSTAVGRRWADLLICEHLAHRVLEEEGITACKSEVLDYGGRVFLQCERFDRVGPEGRRGVVSLFALDTCRYGQLDSWTACAQRLGEDQLLPAEDADRIGLLDAFGALTANTDRHFGNITLFDDYHGPFRLAPAYDMLPMLFAPQSDQIVPRQFEAPTPRAAWLSVWPRARSLAETYWSRVIADGRLSEEFRQLCVASLGALRAMSARGAAVS